MSDIDAIVLDIDGGAMLHECIDALQRQTLTLRTIVVVDNGSRIAVADRLREPSAAAPMLRVIRSESNLGFAEGNNAGFRETTAPLVALVNNDVVVDADWAAAVSAAFDGDPRLGAVQTIIRRDAEFIDGAGIDISNGTIRQIGHGLPLGTTLTEAWGVSATAAVYRRSALGERIFDPRFFAYYEDVELCARLHESGWTTRVLPVAKATHRGSHSASILGREAIRLRTRNRYVVARMHPGVGRVRSLIWEDVKLLLRGRSSLRGMWEGLASRLTAP